MSLKSSLLKLQESWYNCLVMHIYRINKDKLRTVRGKRTRQEIANATNGKVKMADIYSWETDWQPSKERFIEAVPALAKALGCSIEEITDQIAMTV